MAALQDSLAPARGTPPDALDPRRVEDLAAPLRHRTADPLPGVKDTLDALTEHYTLLLLTRGETAEQHRLLDSSGLRGYFSAIRITQEKTEHTYLRLVADHRLDPATTWMIGNSPRSDILPARAAGLRAIHIPGPSLWPHDDADLDPNDPGTITLRQFEYLLDVFVRGDQR